MKNIAASTSDCHLKAFTYESRLRLQSNAIPASSARLEPSAVSWAKRLLSTETTSTGRTTLRPEAPARRRPPAVPAREKALVWRCVFQATPRQEQARQAWQ